MDVTIKILSYIFLIRILMKLFESSRYFIVSISSVQLKKKASKNREVRVASSPIHL